MHAATEPRPLRFAIIGCGFWAHYQAAAWHELIKEGRAVELVSVCDRDEHKARALAEKFDVSKVYSDAGELFRHDRLDFVDIIADAEAHAPLCLLAAQHGVDAIVQKPMAPGLQTAQQMMQVARKAGTTLLVHENFRWQAPLRRLKERLDEGAIGPLFKARLTFCSGFPVYENQPFLAQLERFILTDIGTHLLDVARFLGGEARTLHCKTRRVNPAIRGEDVADVLMEMKGGAHFFVEMSYASLREHETFPQTLALLEGENGSLELKLNGEIALTTREGQGRVTRTETVTPPFYSWVDPEYAVAQSSAVACCRNLLDGLEGTAEAETTGEDNLRTLQLVFAAYQSAEHNSVVTIEEL